VGTGGKRSRGGPEKTHNTRSMERGMGSCPRKKKKGKGGGQGEGGQKLERKKQHLLEKKGGAGPCKGRGG